MNLLKVVITAVVALGLGVAGWYYRHSAPLTSAAHALGVQVESTTPDTAATLHAHGVTDIQTSAQAAEALRPFAGRFAFLLFSMGIIGTGLLAVPVLAGSAAYAVSEMFGWAGTLDARPNDARAFYATIAVATLLGAALSVVGLDPVRALYWAAVVNGVLASPLMAVMMLIVRNPRVMGRLTLSRAMAIWGWAATGVMAAASLAFFILR